ARSVKRIARATLRAVAALAGLLALGACGPDEVDLTGIYKVEADLQSAPCGTDQPVTNPPVAVKFVKGEFFGATVYSYSECDDLAATMCAGMGLLDAGFSEPIDGGWRGIVTTSGGGGTTCTISYTEQTATLHGTLLIVEITNYSDQVDNTPTLCSPDEADRRNISMPCAEHHRIEATKQ
ncbi:MAG TPA: hypothetical protein VL326_33275, partial [Kofleriaceae bacterium]|nr:hypothetical protein [Kofleriaceae bacterium]